MSEDRTEASMLDLPVLRSIEDVSPKVPGGSGRAVFDRFVKIAEDNGLSDLSEVARIAMQIQKEEEEGAVDRYILSSTGLRYPMELAANIPRNTLPEVKTQVAALAILEFVTHVHGPFKVDVGSIVHLQKSQGGRVPVENLWFTPGEPDKKEEIMREKGTQTRSIDFFLTLYDELELKSRLTDEGDYNALCKVRELEREFLPSFLKVIELKRGGSKFQYKKVEMLKLMARWSEAYLAFPWKRISPLIPQRINEEIREVRSAVRDLAESDPDLFRP